MTEEEKDQENREAIIRIKGDEWNAEQVEQAVDNLRKLRHMDSAEWQKHIEEEDRAADKRDYEIHAARPKSAPMSEEEFENLIDKAKAEKERVESLPRDWREPPSNVTLWDYMETEWTLAAYAVNPGETYRAIWGRYPKLTGHYGHTPEYWRKEKYFVCKAIACGIADTAEKAVQYFKDNK